MSCEKRFHTELRDRRLRLTPQRGAILAALHEFEAPVTAEEIHRRSRELNPGLEFSTVYRTLDLLKSLGLVSVVDAGGRQQRFLHVSTERPHFHLRCRDCGSVQGLGLDRLQELAARILQEVGFQLDAANVTLPGVCRKCR